MAPTNTGIQIFDLMPALVFKTFIMQQGIDGYARKHALRQDTDYMVEKTYHDIAPYLGFWGLFIASVTQIWFKR